MDGKEIESQIFALIDRLTRSGAPHKILRIFLHPKLFSDLQYSYREPSVCIPITLNSRIGRLEIYPNDHVRGAAIDFDIRFDGHPESVKEILGEFHLPDRGLLSDSMFRNQPLPVEEKPTPLPLIGADFYPEIEAFEKEKDTRDRN